MLGEVNATSAGAQWAKDDLALAREHPNKWAVAIPNELIAVGDDPDAVRTEAAEKLGLPENSIVLTVLAAVETRLNYDWF